jgi:hypothetical protein
MTDQPSKVQDVFDLLAAQMTAAAQGAGDQLTKDSYAGRDWVAGALRDAFGHQATKTAMLAALSKAVEAEPGVVIGHMFERSGNLIRSKASELIDQMVVDALTENAEKFKPWIEEYVKANLEHFVLNAIVQVFLAHMAGTLSDISRTVAESADTMITQAFQNASINRRY